VGELDSNGSLLSRFIYGAQSSSPDAMVRSGVTYAFVKDHLGSVRLVIDASSGTVLQRLEYDAWGVVTQNTAPGVQPFGYAGGVQDIDTGFTHFGFRDYDPASGLWTATDPIRLRVGGGYLSPEPYLQRPNWVAGQAKLGRTTPTYSYALNNPLKYTDPSGLYSWIGACPDIGLNTNRGVYFHNDGAFGERRTEGGGVVGFDNNRGTACEDLKIAKTIVGSFTSPLSVTLSRDCWDALISDIEDACKREKKARPDRFNSPPAVCEAP
jgi:RHS repeat-associated protein